MATRSTIAIERADGTVARIYCHWDGYPEGVGATLKQHYTTPEKIEALIALGAVSSLDASIECPEGHNFNNRVDGCTIFYGRDRGDKNCEAEILHSYQMYLNGEMQEYNYIFRNGAWEYLTESQARAKSYSLAVSG